MIRKLTYPFEYKGVKVTENKHRRFPAEMPCHVIQGVINKAGNTTVWYNITYNLLRFYIL